ncbi:hypothetical protein LCGC14_1070180 [marine sediment metagenome]|uniref:SpoVT-AbrB domain-containing protein n=1 Tax=marine sediment metagenome TaxID=412755 RepID=A0A0F9MNB6_9ZZZZ
MVELRMVKLQEMMGQFSITIPKSKILRKGWKKGQELDIDFNEKGNLEIVEIEKTFKKKGK